MNKQGLPVVACLQGVLVMVALVLQLGSVNPAAAGDGDSIQQLPIVDLGQDRYKVGQIEVDKGRQSFTLTGRFIKRELPDGPVEYLAVVPDGLKSYETLLELNAGAREFNLACILIGLDARNAVLPRFHFDPEPIQGDPVELVVSWDAGGQIITRRPGEFFTANGKDVLPDEWVYTGSILTDKGNYLAESMGLLISFAHEPASIIEHRSGLGIGGYGTLQVNKATTAPPGTPITLTLSRPKDPTPTADR